MDYPDLSTLKNWTPAVEGPITTAWKAAEHFSFDAATTKPIYSIDTPPPYINAPIHMGHATTYSFMDMFARYKRMKGFEVLFPLGLDNNGLPIEMGAEKKYKISAFHMERGEFLSYCKKLLDECGVESVDSFAKLGISFSSYGEGDAIGSVYKTDSPEYRAITQRTFLELYKKGFVYEDRRINNWDPKLRTTIADSEIEYKDVSSTFNDIVWTVKETGEQIVIGTTRPELIVSCGMVIYHPDDERYSHLEGKTAVTPLFDLEVPIKAHPLADPEKGTGIVMMCSAGDLSDIQFFREQQIDTIISINQDGTMNSNAHQYEGLKVREARERILEDLKAHGLLQRQEQITHRTPVSERSGAEVEFIEMPEFYLRQVEIKDDIRRVAKDIHFFPEFSRKILSDWIDSVSIDWPISRRRYYATEIPLWSARNDVLDDDYIAVPRGGQYYQPWKEDVPEDAEVFIDGRSTGKRVSDFPDLEWIGETRVMDTWMDSSISELVLLKYRQDDTFFQKAYPASLRPQGKEIVRTWLYYTILRGYLETGKPCFEDVWIHQHILDGKGRKMSKSAGNIIDPQELLRDFGAEAMRLWAATEGDLSKQDFMCSKDRIRGEQKTLNKLLNISRFVMQFEEPTSKPPLTALDQLFVDFIEDLTARCDEGFSQYDFFHPSLDLRRFLWDVFASHYLEMVKARAYNEGEKFSLEASSSARWTLYFLLDRLVVLLYPVIPQITSTIAFARGRDLLTTSFPGAQRGESDLSLVDDLMAFNSQIWKQKKDQGLSLRSELSGVTIPENLSAFRDDLVATHCLSL